MGRRQEKSRIDVSGTAVSGGLQPDAFAALGGLALPAGPESGGPPADDTAPVPTGPRGRVVLRRETARRGGKTVVVVSGFDPTLGAEAIGALARAVRKACGCGGTVQGREIEVQGDQPAKVAAFFRDQGFRVAGVVE